MYQVLYRKWRPKTFDEVCGQEHITDTLKNEIINNKIAHAYLFTGIRGTGKTTCAKILAKAINCLSPVNGNPCGECEACKSIENESTVDVLEIDAAGNNGVENIRSIIEESTFTPANLKKRVYIIDEVHMLSIGAFNAFLKTLEEPPEHVVFILATTEINKLPATILSRCQRFDFFRISIGDMVKRLEYIAEKEDFIIEPDAAKLLAKLANGALRDALSILDRCIMNMNDKNNIYSKIIINYESVVDAVGLVGKEALFSLADKLIRKDSTAAISELQSFYHSSKDIPCLIKELVEHFRDLMIVKSSDKPGELLEFTGEDIDIVKKQAESTTIDDILCILDILKETSLTLKNSSDSKIMAEITIVKICNRVNSSNRNNDKAYEDVVSKMNIIEKKLASLLSRPQAPNIDKETKQKAIPKTQEQAIKTNININETIKNAKPTEDWDKVLLALDDTSRTMATAFKGSKAYISGDYLFIESDNELVFEQLRKSSNRDKIRLIIENITGKKYKLGPYPKEKNVESKSVDPLDEFILDTGGLGIDINANVK